LLEPTRLRSGRVASLSGGLYRGIYARQNQPFGARRMRFLALWLILLATVGFARAEAILKVGVTTRDFIPVEPYDWRGAKTRALRAMIWYPAAAEAREEAQWIGPPIFPFYSAGSAARDAPHAAGPRRPLILLSHGFGGTASDLAWLGTALAAHGFIAVAVNHPGNNGLEAYTVEGYSLMWLRAVDLGAVIDAVLNDKTFGSRIDPARIGAAGHSFGGYTVVAVAGGITDPARMQAFCRSSAADALCVPSPVISDMRQKSLARLSSDPDFRQRYSAAGNSYRDARVRAIFAMAPGLGPVFTPESLGKVSIPVAFVSGSVDEVTPPTSGAEALAKAIPHATLKLFPRSGHFVFFGTCTLVGRIFLRAECGDPGGTERNAVHAETIKLALDFFTENLR
jgi:predicted dienelactone hydrolase